MGAIFINYRREDSSSTAGRLHDRLAAAFGRKTIFMDVDNIPVGVDFVKHLNRKLAECKVVLVVIGPNWLSAKDEAGQRRLEQPGDYVAIEIEAALTRDIRIIPVLVDGAAIPKPSELPDSLKPLARRQGFETRHNNFGRDVDALIEKVRDALGGAAWRLPWRWMKVAGGTTALLLVGSIVSFWFWAPAAIETIVPKQIQAKAPTVEKAEGQRGAAANAEERRKSQAAADAEIQRTNQEAEQQRLAAAKVDEQRKAKVAAAVEAEAQRKSQEAEQQRLAAARAEEQRNAAQDSQRASFTAATNLQIIENVSIAGDEYRYIPDSTIDSCSGACAGDPQCKMFSYWPSKICYLFNGEFGVRSAQAGVRVGLVRVSPKLAVQQRSTAVIASVVKNAAVRGKEYLLKGDATIESCSSSCVEDTKCKMFAYWRGGLCYLFDKNSDTYANDTSQVGRVR